MPLWHCPHCGTPQAEAARCWVCRKSSTSCATCRHFRHAVAGQLGYCALDRRRDPLRGNEIRGCWESDRPVPIGIGARTAEVLAPQHPTIAWTEVAAGVLEPTDAAEDVAVEAPAAASRLEPAPSGLWGDLEP